MPKQMNQEEQAQPCRDLWSHTQTLQHKKAKAVRETGFIKQFMKWKIKKPHWLLGTQPGKGSPQPKKHEHCVTMIHVNLVLWQQVFLHSSCQCDQSCVWVIRQNNFSQVTKLCKVQVTNACSFHHTTKCKSLGRLQASKLNTLFSLLFSCRCFYRPMLPLVTTCVKTAGTADSLKITFWVFLVQRLNSRHMPYTV